VSIWQPIIGCIPLLLAETENSNAQNKLFLSVTATAGIFSLTQRSGRDFSRIAPCKSEYSE
jgi:hypothetical protein